MACHARHNWLLSLAGFPQVQGVVLACRDEPLGTFSFNFLVALASSITHVALLFSAVLVKRAGSNYVVGVERQRIDPVRVVVESATERAVAGAPDLDGCILGGRVNQTLTAPLDAGHALCVLCKGNHTFASNGRKVPHLCRSILGGTDKSCAPCRGAVVQRLPRNPCDKLAMPRQWWAHHSTSRRVPHINLAVCATRGQCLGIGSPSHALHPVLVTLASVLRGLRPNVPKPHRLVPTSGSKPPPIRAEIQLHNVVRVPGNGRRALSHCTNTKHGLWLVHNGDNVLAGNVLLVEVCRQFLKHLSLVDKKRVRHRIVLAAEELVAHLLQLSGCDAMGKLKRGSKRLALLVPQLRKHSAVCGTRVCTAKCKIKKRKNRSRASKCDGEIERAQRHSLVCYLASAPSSRRARFPGAMVAKACRW
eukprot:m.42353 g.42353  ORF g.42353 m.42353 type:complete len:419 (-) comp11535_c0_seq4:36-1292(-)